LSPGGSATLLKQLSLPFSNTWKVSAVDFNSDGLIDVVSIPIGFSVNPIAFKTPNFGSGNFAPPIPFYVGNNIIDVYWGDINLDGAIDLITKSTSDVELFLSNGQGILGPVSTQLQIPIDTLVDVNGDGRLDAIAMSTNPAGISVSLGDPVTTFGATQLITTTNPCGTAIGVADFDSDLRTDLLTLGSGGFTTWLNTSYPPPLETYGTGTPGCTGPEVLSANKLPKIGTQDFTIRCTNAPPTSTGLWLICDSKDIQGSDPFSIGAKLHVDLFGATELLAYNSGSDSQGIGLLTVAIPNNANIVGKEYDVQALWVWPLTTCFNFPYGVSTSNGLAMTLLP
jgi:hypothetical protein